MNEDKKFLTKSNLLGRGWTERMIKELLPEPVKKQNPRYKSSPPMLLWEEDIVLKKENLSEFKEAKAKKEKRSLIMKEVAQSKRQELLKEVSRYQIIVKKISMAELEENTINEKMARSDYLIDWTKITPLTLMRRQVNHVRHNLTNYEKLLEKLSRRVGKHEAYLLIRERIFEKIIEVYPYLSDECKRQVSSREDIMEFLQHQEPHAVEIRKRRD